MAAADRPAHEGGRGVGAVLVAVVRLRGGLHGAAHPVELGEVSHGPLQGRVLAVDARVEVRHEDPRPREALVPQGRDAEPLDAPGARLVQPRGRHPRRPDGAEAGGPADRDDLRVRAESGEPVTVHRTQQDPEVGEEPAGSRRHSEARRERVRAPDGGAREVPGQPAAFARAGRGTRPRGRAQDHDHLRRPARLQLLRQVSAHRRPPGSSPLRKKRRARHTCRARAGVRLVMPCQRRGTAGDPAAAPLRVPGRGAGRGLVSPRRSARGRSGWTATGRPPSLPSAPNLGSGAGSRKGNRLSDEARQDVVRHQAPQVGEGLQ